MDQSVVPPEVPLDRAELGPELDPGQAGLLANLADGGGARVLPFLEVALGQPPVLIGIADQQDVRNAVARPDDDPSGALLLANRPADAQKMERRT